MKKIPLTQGKFALIDDDDFEIVGKQKWRLHRIGNISYAQTNITDRKTISMHRLITIAPTGFVVDHINRNGLDNRRANLRIATYQQNCWNKKMTKNKYGYKGISFHKSSKSFRAEIYLNGKCIHIGYFPDPKTAAKAYDKAAIKYYGAYACLNFPGANYGS